MPEPERSTLSVVLPNYNHGRLLGRAVTALLSQERRPDEIVIIDDGSTDDSRATIAALSSASGRIRVLLNETNKGVTFSQMRGLQAVTGKYVYFAAADDWVLPGFFAAGLQLLESHPRAALVCGEARLVSGHTGKNLGMRPVVRPSGQSAYLPPEAVAALLKTSDNWILTGSAIFVREHVVVAGGLLPELGSFADGYLARKLALTHGFCYLPQPVATWQVFEDSFSRETASDPARAELLLTIALAQIERDPCFPRWYGELLRRRWQFAFARVAVTANSINDDVLVKVSARNRLDAAVISVLCRLRPVAVVRPLLLAWLWCRLTPMSLKALLVTFLERRFRRDDGAAGPR